MNELEQSFWELVEAGEIELALSLDKGLVPDAYDILLSVLWKKCVIPFYNFFQFRKYNTSNIFRSIKIYFIRNKIGDRTNIIFTNGRFVENLPF